jgi:hypothetical protein
MFVEMAPIGVGAQMRFARPWIGVLCGLLSLSFGCTRPEREDRSLAKPPIRATPMPADVHFRRAVLFKPRHPEHHGRLGELAPLIVQEVGDDASPEIAVLEVYAVASETAGRSAFRQVMYAWRREGEGSERQDRWSAICMTLDHSGFPMAVEVLGRSDSAARVLFVSTSLESAARALFGNPAPGRRYAVERPMDETPHVIVVGDFEDGPIPMGPYVYVAADRREIAAVICRCSPSRVDEFSESTYYELPSVERFGDGWPWDDIKIDGAGPLVHPATANSGIGSIPGWPSLDQVLRWPQAPENP